MAGAAMCLACGVAGSSSPLASAERSAHTALTCLNPGPRDMTIVQIAAAVRPLGPGKNTLAFASEKPLRWHKPAKAFLSLSLHKLQANFNSQS